MTIITRNEFKSLPKQDYAMMEEIEERLRSPSGRMPTTVDMKRRLQILREALPKIQEREKKWNKYLTPAIIIILVLITLQRTVLRYLFTDWMIIVFYAVIATPMIGFYLLQLIDQSRVYGSAKKAELEIMLLTFCLKEKGELT